MAQAPQPAPEANPAISDTTSIRPKLFIAAVAVIGLAVMVTTMNPHRKYSTRQFWETATVETVAEVPEKALQPANKNGSVLMWAAMGARDAEILRALVARGADVNESDTTFGGTPLSAAAGKSERPEMIAVLVELGGDVNKRVNNGETPAMVAARYNFTPGMIEALHAAGADLTATNDQGQTALEIASEAGNAVAEKALRDL